VGPEGLAGPAVPTGTELRVLSPSAQGCFDDSRQTWVRESIFEGKVKYCKRILIGTELLCALITPGSLADDRPPGQRWWSHAKALAEDRFEGRKCGSEGYLRAAEYVAREFAKLGLAPAGTRGFFQPVPLISREIDKARSSLTLVSATGSEPLTLGREAIIGLEVDPAAMAEAELVFAGYGLSIPHANHDDFADLDVQGKLVVFLAATPSRLPDSVAVHIRSPSERATLMRRKGAIGSCAILHSKNQASDWKRLAQHQFDPIMMLADPALNDGRDLKLFLHLNPEHAERVFAGSGHSLQEICDADAAGAALPRFASPKRIKAEIRTKRTELISPNVVAMLPGTDPQLKNECVVFSAHLDHLGISAPIAGDSLYNGAMDNAAGVASLLDVTALLSERGIRLRRSVLLVAFTGEEDGMLGSRFFVASASGTTRRIVANVNLDTFLPIFALRRLAIYGREESNLGELAAAVAESMGVTPMSDIEPERNTLIRSDQYSFLRRGIPALALKFGFEQGSREHWAVKIWRADRYHSPADDPSQPVDMPAAEAFNTLVAKILERVANNDQAPRFADSSFYKRFAN
jgi:Peptidase family M28